MHIVNRVKHTFVYPTVTARSIKCKIIYRKEPMLFRESEAIYAEPWVMLRQLQICL